MALSEEQRTILELTSRTFYLPIMGLPGILQETVASAYLCFRAIDEIEDHGEVAIADKISILNRVSEVLQAGPAWPVSAWDEVFGEWHQQLPEVTLRLSEWALMAPGSFAPRIWDATAGMAHRMAVWAERGWTVGHQSDLDHYTFSVAGAVGLLLSDIWGWYDGTITDRTCAVGYGRGLQMVNMLRNREEDLARGVDFFPPGWTEQDMGAHCREQLSLGEHYNTALTPGPVSRFCRIPLALATATLDALEAGRDRLSRSEVVDIVMAIDGAT